MKARTPGDMEWTMGFLTHRNRRPEVMDQPGLDEHEHRSALCGLKRVDQISGSAPLIWKNLTAWAGRDARRPLRVLDLGCGGGNLAIRLAKRARKAGLAIEFHGVEINPTAVAIAREEAALAGVECRFDCLDALHEPLPKDFDVILSSLFLHHFDDADAIRLLAKARESARRQIMMDDLRRTPLGFVLCCVGCRLLTRSRVVRVDGPLSVRAAWTLDEVRDLADAAGLSAATIRPHWPQRFLLSWVRQ